MHPHDSALLCTAVGRDRCSVCFAALLMVDSCDDWSLRSDSPSVIRSLTAAAHFSRSLHCAAIDRESSGSVGGDTTGVIVAAAIDRCHRRLLRRASAANRLRGAIPPTGAPAAPTIARPSAPPSAQRDSLTLMTTRLDHSTEDRLAAEGKKQKQNL